MVQVKRASYCTKAFYAAEAGLETGIKLLTDDLYYTPEGTKASWDDNVFYGKTENIQVQTRKYMNPNNAHYDDDFYPLVAETDYAFDGNGSLKSTYQISLSNVPGYPYRIWVKSTGSYYRGNESGTGFILEAERSILTFLEAKNISPWSNAIFAGEGASGKVINGNVDIRGSVHLLATSLGSADIAMDMSGSGSVKNNYSGIPLELGSRIPSIQRLYDGELMDSLEAEVRIQHGKLGLSGSSRVGEPDVPGNGLKETVDGAYIPDGYTGNQAPNFEVYSDNGQNNQYDLSEFDIPFPRMSEPYGGYPTYLDYLRNRDEALVISDPDALNQLGNIDPRSVFSYSGNGSEISMDGSGHLTIRGIVVVEGDVDLDKYYEKTKIVADTIEYEGRGVLASAHNAFIKCNLITRGFSTYPKVDILGVMAADRIEFDRAGLEVMGVFYGGNKIVSKKQTSVAGTFFSPYFDMGSNVPSIYQVPDVVHNLPPGMIGNFRLWQIKRMMWREV